MAFYPIDCKDFMCNSWWAKWHFSQVFVIEPCQLWTKHYSILSTQVKHATRLTRKAIFISLVCMLELSLHSDTWLVREYESMILFLYIFKAKQYPPPPKKNCTWLITEKWRFFVFFIEKIVQEKKLNFADCKVMKFYFWSDNWSEISCGWLLQGNIFVLRHFSENQP